MYKFFLYINSINLQHNKVTKHTLTLPYYTNDTPGSNVLFYPGAKNTYKKKNLTDGITTK